MNTSDALGLNATACSTLLGENPLCGNCGTLPMRSAIWDDGGYVTGYVACSRYMYCGARVTDNVNYIVLKPSSVGKYFPIASCNGLF